MRRRVLSCALAAALALFSLPFGIGTPIAAMLIDGSSAKSNVIEPRHIAATLEKDQGEGAPIVFLMDDAAFRSITWISVTDVDRPAIR
jgi:hypothetical protein